VTKRASEPAAQRLVATSLCMAFRAVGGDMPAAVWVLRAGAVAVLAVSMANLYGYREAQTAAIPLLTVPLAVALIPVAAWLGL
jgi:predicted permease